MNTLTNKTIKEMFTAEMNELLANGYTFETSTNVSTTETCLFFKKGKQTVRLAIYDMRKVMDNGYKYNAVLQILLQETHKSFDDHDVNVIKASPVFYEITKHEIGDNRVFVTSLDEYNEIKELQDSRAMNKYVSVPRKTLQPTQALLEKLNKRPGFKSARLPKITVQRTQHAYVIKHSKQTLELSL